MHCNGLRYKRPFQFVLGKMFIAQTLFAIVHNALQINNENLLPVQLCQSCKQLVIVLDNLCCNQTLRLVLDWQFEHFFFCKGAPPPQCPPPTSWLEAPSKRRPVLQPVLDWDWFLTSGQPRAIDDCPASLVRMAQDDSPHQDFLEYFYSSWVIKSKLCP